MTRQFPKPGDRLERVELNHPGLHKGSVLVEVPAIDRQQNHISQIDPNHSLLPIAFDCLKDEGNERLSAHQLCERVAELKGTPKYVDSARTVQDKDEEIRQLRQQIREKDQTNRQQLDEKERQLGLLNQQLRQLQIENDQNARQKYEKERQLRLLNQQVKQLQLENDQNSSQKEEKERQLGHVNQQLETSEQAVAQFERRIAELEQQLNQREQQKTKASNREKELTSSKLRWRAGKRAPCKMSRWCDAVDDGNTVYVKKDICVNIYSYDVISDNWSQLPDCIYEKGSITVINGWLTTARV